MTKEADLVKLESVVTSLMGRFNALKQEKSELEAQLEAKEERIDELNEQINSLTTEKSDVRGRVSSLLGSIEDWEQNLATEKKDGSADSGSAGDSTNSDGKIESKLFQVGEE